MAWTIEFHPAAAKELDKLPDDAARRILKFLAERVARLDDPRAIGELWKYRVGDFRIIADIQDRAVLILVVRIGNRRDVYKR